MKINELKTQLVNAKLYPIFVHMEFDEDSSNQIVFDGDFNGYIAALKVLDVKAVFIAANTLEEENFIIDSNSDSVEEDSNELDLCNIQPKLKKFKDKIGQAGIFKLFSSLSNEGLIFFIKSEWWAEYVECFIDAVETYENQNDDISKKLQEDKEKKNKTLVSALHNLLEDKYFRSLTTQRAMNAYAHEKISNLNLYDPKALKLEIQKLYDKIRMYS
ncbi:MAG: hypothetical protein JWM96_848 [Alphaproteobacteria bacterium]|nr:hypothetical protein [Alphaproteobacteria bacterium]